ncbi:hypothetical protein [Bradyrhizobium sp. CCBAU 11434]|uniref:hypothetical protein n=1 Tax=Bradyrhizobium sp. CCBAU 11434 TaxID=1630885 RepID=UPI002306327D|nr:hypothetical protein [Bradyrhizobium sp. CCBAU 11434]
MPTPFRSLIGTFHGVANRMLAALHQQRAIEARRVLRRYRHLLETQHETLPLNEIDSVCSEEEFIENAHRSDAHQHSASRRSLEHT